jgi:hypothetical protein
MLIPAKTWLTVLSRIVVCYVLTILCHRAGFAEIITYTLYNAPSVQQNTSGSITTKTVSGTITVNTTGLTPAGSGWFIGENQESNITSWQFTVSGGTTSYVRSSNDTGVGLDISGGGSVGMFATATTLSVESGAKLEFGSLTSPNQTMIMWNNGFSGHEYFSNNVGNVNPNGFSTIGEGTLDAAFPSDGLGGWVMATAVPEPGSFALLATGLLGALIAGGFRQHRRRVRAAHAPA